jgi:SAM-dependent methyltransferase
MATTEHTINDALAEVLTETRSLWRFKGVVRSENIDVLKSSGKKPDILITEPNVSPVILETEILPSISVESDARQRLGEHLTPSGRRILSSLAVRLPVRLRDFSGQLLKKEILNASDFEMALYTGESSESYTRWPRNGWLRGNVIDLSIITQSASVPPAVVEEAANKLVDGVSEAAALLTDMAIAHPGAMKKICEELRQQDGEQTRRMATTILANALVFHESLARGNGDLYNVRTLDELRGKRSGVSKNEMLEDWKRILKVNYWPIFDIARRILEVIPMDTARPLLDRLVTTAGELVANHMMRSHDLTGAVFQRLIADRKFLAAYYTHPASAALLVGLAINSDRTPGNGSWSKEKDVIGLRVADFACGTGTLLSAAYRRISQLHEAAGGDAELIHPEMMATALVGCDVLPAATHLTASMLAGAHPTVKYSRSSIMTVGYGPREGGGVALGSLDLLDPQRAFDIIAITAKAVEGLGENEKDTWSTLPHASFDLVIMNPPFTRDTDHSAIKAEVLNPMFAAFNSKTEEQREMAKAASRLLQGTSAHGNAGEASAFLVLADRKLKNNGTIAIVMPLSLMFGEAWEASRQLLRKSYGELVLISIAGSKDNDLSFSADTGMAECLIIGHKGNVNNARATFVVLNERPSSTMTGSSAAVQIRKLKEGRLRKLEDGPVGGSMFHFGDDIIGYAIDAALPEKGPWNLARIKDGVLAQAAYQIANCGLVWLPSMTKNSAISVYITTVSKIGQVGPVHRDINGNTTDGGIRGPFQIEALTTAAAPTYPVLWSHDADRERCIEFEADSEGVIRQGASSAEDINVKNKADRIWATASHCHFNADFRFNSQSTAMQFTRRLTIGGSAWPSINLASTDQEKVLTLWGNSSLGLLLHWWHSNKQQAGRGRIGVSALTSMPVLDVTKLSEEAISKAVAIFDDMKNRELRPINEISKDTVRQEIDVRLATEVLGFPPELTAPDGPITLLKQKLALEPSITGSKSIS